MPCSDFAGRGAAANDGDEYLRAVRHLGADDDSRVDMDAALNEFWAEETEKCTAALQDGDFKASNDLPLARIKRIMKSDEDVRMIAAEAPGMCLCGFQRSPVHVRVHACTRCTSIVRPAMVSVGV